MKSFGVFQLLALSAAIVAFTPSCSWLGLSKADAVIVDPPFQSAPRSFPSLPEPKPPAPASEPTSPAGFPVAKPVPGKEGYVFSPFNNSLIDVKGLMSGTLVSDPRFQLSERKFFRVP